MIDEDLKQRKIANGTYIEDWILHKLVKGLNAFERRVVKVTMKTDIQSLNELKNLKRKIDLIKIKIRNRVYKIESK